MIQKPAPPHRRGYNRMSLSPMNLGTSPNLYRTPKTTLHTTFKKVRIASDRRMDKKLWRFTDEYNIALNSGKIARLTLRRLGDKLLTNLFTKIGFKGTKLIHINICILANRDLSLADIVRRDGRGFSENPRTLKPNQRKSTISG